MKPAVKTCGYMYYAHVTTWVYKGMHLINYPENIIKGLEDTYIIQVIKEQHENYIFTQDNWYEYMMRQGQKFKEHNRN